MHYDVAVIGAGPGGYLAAQRAGEAGMRTVVFEKENIGGVCLNEGCIPSKSFLNSAKLYDHAKNIEVFGVTAENVRIDQAAVLKRKNRVVKLLVSGVQSQLKAAKVEIVKVEARLVGRNGNGYTIVAGDATYTATRVILATGSEPVLPPIPGVKEGLEAGYVLTNRGILDLAEIPGRLTIVGGGVIGLEMASYYRTCGSEVTVIEMLDHIAGAVDADIGKALQSDYEKKGIKFILNSPVTKIEKGVVHYGGENPGQVEADLVLMSIGRRPVSRGLGLEELGVYMERGRVVTDRHCQTNLPGLYAVGDVNGVWLLAHVAYREAEVAVNHIVGRPDNVMRYQGVPSVIYTSPEVGFAGLTEKDAAEKGYDYKVINLPLNFSGRYMAENDRGQGFIKLIMDNKTTRMLGCHMFGNPASELILVASIFIDAEFTVEQMLAFIYPHPTVGEIIKEALAKF